MVGGFQWMIVGTLDGTEGGHGETKFRRMGLALVKKSVPDPLPPIRPIQDRFPEIEDLPFIDSSIRERTSKGLIRFLERQPGRGTDNLPTINGQHADTSRRSGVTFKILALGLLAAVIQVGKLPEHPDAQPRDICQMRKNGCACEPANLDHGTSDA